MWPRTLWRVADQAGLAGRRRRRRPGPPGRRSASTWRRSRTRRRRACAPSRRGGGGPPRCRWRSAPRSRSGWSGPRPPARCAGSARPSGPARRRRGAGPPTACAPRPGWRSEACIRAAICSFSPPVSSARVFSSAVTCSSNLARVSATGLSWASSRGWASSSRLRKVSSLRLSSSSATRLADCAAWAFRNSADGRALGLERSGPLLRLRQLGAGQVAAAPTARRRVAARVRVRRSWPTSAPRRQSTSSAENKEQRACSCSVP